VKRTGPLPLAERVEVERALEGAFAPLRLRRTSVSPLRVRAAVRWGRGTPPQAVRWSGTVARISELSLAAGMCVMVFVGALGSVTQSVTGTGPASLDEAVDPALYPVPRVTAPLDDERYIRWLRLDRFVPLQDWLDPSVVRPSSSRFSAPLDLPAPSVDSNRPF
jgi:hypothetical protein